MYVYMDILIISNTSYSAHYREIELRDDTTVSGLIIRDNHDNQHWLCKWQDTKETHSVYSVILGQISSTDKSTITNLMNIKCGK